MDLLSAIGIYPDGSQNANRDPFLIEYANLKLSALECPIYGKEDDYPFMSLAKPLLKAHQENSRLLADHHSPADRRIQAFLDDYLQDVEGESIPRLPGNSFVLDRHGLARVLSVPPNSDQFQSDIVQSYRSHNGVLHNPAKDRRTTEGVFHVAEGGLPIPADKKAVPKLTFLRLLQRALNPPSDLQRLPFTSCQEKQAECWVSLLMRPTVCPEIPGRLSRKSYEVRFFAPGNLVCNLDFVESIFGNAGDPNLPENDAALDVEHWTGHSGCVILAPHLVNFTKKELGLPPLSEATERQKRDGMCWEKEDELYNNGNAFKATVRDARGVVVTLIADNYFGYCKKEVKTQISFSANLYGFSEEEHAGGAIAFPSYDLGEEFELSRYYNIVDHTFDGLVKRHGDQLIVQPEGYAVDRKYPDILYVPQDARFSLSEQKISWVREDGEKVIRLQPNVTYVLPSGYKVEMVKPHAARRWRLVGTTAEGTFCHKPCTVSGGGKSEISKPITDAIIHAPVFVADFKSDFDLVETIINRDYSTRFKEPAKPKSDSRSLLSPERSLGSVVKLLTPSPEYNDDFNQWLSSIPFYVKELVFIVKRFHKPDWGDDWRSRFKVDMINGVGGNELKYRETKLLTQYLRVGFQEDGSWRTFGLRKDFAPALKLQTEDDISASAVVPREWVQGLYPHDEQAAVKFLENCEYRLFQRPDDAIHRGYDKKTERDFAQTSNFFSNYEPLSRDVAVSIAEDTIRFDQYTKPIQEIIHGFLKAGQPDFIILPSHPRIVEGKPSKNPRYLQNRDDLVNPRSFYLGELGVRLYRRISSGNPVPMPVNAVLPGRRNNPPEPGIRSLAVFNPIHYLPLPEFFMEVISSMTGKSPSTTGAGSEGALTKGPFNALPPITDLNNALISFLITGYQPFITAAGYVGPKFRVDHDISLLVPELWSRMRSNERDPGFMIREGYLERCEDLVINGKTVPSNILGYRINASFVRSFFGRVFANPAVVLCEEMLKPETQDMGCFADGMDNIIATHKRVAALYFEDNSIEGACPPLKALLTLMAEGRFDAASLNDPDFRKLFDRDSLLDSDWYQERLKTRQQVETLRLRRQIEDLEHFLTQPNHQEMAGILSVQERIRVAKQELKQVVSSDYPSSISGTLGTDPYLYRRH